MCMHVCVDGHTSGYHQDFLTLSPTQAYVMTLFIYSPPPPTVYIHVRLHLILVSVPAVCGCILSQCVVPGSVKAESLCSMLAVVCAAYCLSVCDSMCVSTG